MMLLPQRCQFVEMRGGYGQYVTHIRLACVAWPDGICPVRERDPTVEAKIDDYLYLSVETMHMPRLMIHAVNDEPYAIEPDRAHLSP
jgi:hypothetical protein